MFQTRIFDLYLHSAVHIAHTSTVVLLLAKNHIRERGQTAKDGAAHPCSVLTLWSSDNFDTWGCRGEPSAFSFKTLWKAIEQAYRSKGYNIRCIGFDEKTDLQDLSAQIEQNFAQL